MKVLITGAKGFVGQNLCAALEEIRLGHDNRPEHALGSLTVYRYDLGNTPEELDAWCADCEFVFNLVGVNRPEDAGQFMAGNVGFASRLLDTLKKHGNRCPVMLASSVQAGLAGRYAGSEYGKSKRAGEELFFRYGAETGTEVLVYRFQNIFGKWCRPNYNSAIATFCHNAAHAFPIQVIDPALALDVAYIDDVVEELIQALRGNANKGAEGFCSVPVHYETTLGQLADTISSFSTLRESLQVPQLDDPLTKKLYATYLSYLPEDHVCYDLKMRCDPRGSFTEILRTADRGQFSVNIVKPGVTKGNHWHHTKHEKYVVVKGEGLIQTRRVGKQPDGSNWPVREFRVSGNHIQAVEMIPGYAHNLINLSETEDLVTFVWANEVFEPDRPDTFAQAVSP